MVWILHFLAAVASALVMVSFLPTFFGNLPVPDLIFVAAILLSLREQWTAAYLWLIVGGGILTALVPGWEWVTLYGIVYLMVVRQLDLWLGQLPTGLKLLQILVGLIGLLIVELVSSQTIIVEYSFLFLFIQIVTVGLVAGLLYGINRHMKFS